MTLVGQALRDHVTEAWRRGHDERLTEFRRIAFAASPLEVRLFDGRRRGQERFPQIDADATGVP